MENFNIYGATYFFDKDANDIYYKDTEVNDANITVEDIHKMCNVRDINKMIINF